MVVYSLEYGLLRWTGLAWFEWTPGFSPDVRFVPIGAVQPGRTAAFHPKAAVELE